MTDKYLLPKTVYKKTSFIPWNSSSLENNKQILEKTTSYLQRVYLINQFSCNTLAQWIFEEWSKKNKNKKNCQQKKIYSAFAGGGGEFPGVVSCPFIYSVYIIELLILVCNLSKTLELSQ